MVRDTVYTVASFWVGEIDGKQSYVHAVEGVVGPAGDEEWVKIAHEDAVRSKEEWKRLKNPVRVSVTLTTGPYPVREDAYRPSRFDEVA